jgi:sugar fermentation stimulation protein A
MELNYTLVKGQFIERPNRFIAKIKVKDDIKTVHVPNTGRLGELLVEGADVYLSYHPEKKRKTDYSLRFVCHKGHLVSIDSQLPNKLVKEGLQEGVIDIPYEALSSEVTYNNSRFDFMVEDNKKTYIEVKGVTLQHEGIGMFPDAPTSRGRKHIKELIDAKAEGHEGMIIFLVQYPDIKGFKPNDRMDLAFGNLLREASSAGIAIKAYTTVITTEEAYVKEEIDVLL